MSLVIACGITTIQTSCSGIKKEDNSPSTRATINLNQKDVCKEDHDSLFIHPKIPLFSQKSVHENVATNDATTLSRHQNIPVTFTENEKYGWRTNKEEDWRPCKHSGLEITKLEVFHKETAAYIRVHFEKKTPSLIKNFRLIKVKILLQSGYDSHTQKFNLILKEQVYPLQGWENNDNFSVEYLLYKISQRDWAKSLTEKTQGPTTSLDSYKRKVTIHVLADDQFVKEQIREIASLKNHCQKEKIDHENLIEVLAKDELVNVLVVKEKVFSEGQECQERKIEDISLGDITLSGENKVATSTFVDKVRGPITSVSNLFRKKKNN